MDKIAIEDIIRYTKGEILYQGKDSLIIYDVSTDSRTVTGHDLFIPLIGEHFDGHSYIKSVINNGIQAILTQRKRWEEIKGLKVPKGCWVIGVEDTLKAYQDIARHYLKGLNVIKAGITGSNGKTTTKEILRSILSTHYKVQSTFGNLNNQIGVPKTIFTVDASHDVALIEMGSGKKGDISGLSRIVAPDYGIITNIGLAHTEFLGGPDGVAAEKKALFDGFHHGSVAILNASDPYYPFLSRNLDTPILSFSAAEGHKIKVLNNLGVKGYLLEIYGHRCCFSLGGQHNLTNLHFAIQLAEELKVSKDEIIKGIEEMAPIKMRGETSQGRYTLINDCYNANPSSMKAGLDYFNALNSNGKKISVLGDMLELGSESERLHKDVGRYFSKLNIDYLLTLGDLGKKIAEGAIKNGYVEQKTYSFSEHKSLLERLKSLLEKDDIVYFKASRGLELEKVASEIDNSVE